ncbi:MAG: ABC transporter permease [Chloroflexi bacterium]|nr:ABC transporter permease [Chloroflexota bacterium]
MIQRGGVFWDVLLIQLASWRWTWRAMLVGGIVVPLLVFWLFWAGSGGQLDQERIFVLATGNAILSILYAGSERVARRFAWLREGALDYLAVLPIGRSTLILATILAFTCLSVPGLVVTLVLGIALGGVTVTPATLLAIPVAGLIIWSLVAPAALIGLWSRNTEEATTIAELTTIALILGSPLLYATENMPELWQLVSRWLPSTYAVEALRLTLRGEWGWPLVLDLAVLLGLAGAALVVADRKLEWAR